MAVAAVTLSEESGGSLESGQAPLLPSGRLSLLTVCEARCSVSSLCSLFRPVVSQECASVLTLITF